MTDAELGWLAGMVEGDGTVILQVRKRHRSVELWVKVGVYNTDREIALESARLFAELSQREVPIKLHPSRSVCRTPKPIWSASVHRADEVATILAALGPHMVGDKKRKSFSIVAAVRLFGRRGIGSRGKAGAVPVTDEFKELVSLYYGQWGTPDQIERTRAVLH